MLTNKNISISRLQIVESILFDLKSNVNKKLDQLQFMLQDAEKSRIKLKDSIAKIKLISLSGTYDLKILKRELITQITDALHAFKNHSNTIFQAAKTIDSAIIFKQSWNKCFSNYSEDVTGDFYNIEEMMDLESIITMILNLVDENGEYAISVASDKKSDIKTLKTNVTIFYVMITNAFEVIMNEFSRMENFLCENSQNK